MKKNKGQIIIEVIFLFIIYITFLSVVLHVHQAGKKEIQNSRFNK